jgi:hypothetical protein
MLTSLGTIKQVSCHQLLDARLNVVIPVRLTEGPADDAVHLHVDGVPLGGPVQGDEQHPLPPLLYQDLHNMKIKGSVTRDFRLQVFFMNPGLCVFHWRGFNFFENSRRYSRMNVYHLWKRHRRKIYCSVINTGDKHLFANISAKFRKQFEMVLMGYLGARGKLIREIHFNYAVMLKSVICVPIVPYLAKDYA